jgi:7,8-dihydropterin-6-yl-methyl-4-(beta-D-ribofuranosyl)aminobenzene 5'-phosphate synthase
MEADMPEAVRITVLVENTAFGRDTLGEHGLSFWLETESHRVLFDTGQSGRVLIHNAQALGVDLAGTDSVVLSHGHYDHTGGLEALLKVTSKPKLFLHPSALSQRFSKKKDGPTQEVGVPPSLDQAVLWERASAVVWTEEPTQVVDGVFATGPIPRRNEFEDTGGAFFLDGTCQSPDPIVDDQALFFDTGEGTVVLLGCAHAGIVNTLHYVREVTEDRPIHGVLGGTHLISASEERMARTVEALRGLDLKLLAPGHCTGSRAQVRLGTEFPEQWEACQVGSRFGFFSSNRPGPA